MNMKMLCLAFKQKHWEIGVAQRRWWSFCGRHDTFAPPCGEFYGEMSSYAYNYKRNLMLWFLVKILINRENRWCWKRWWWFRGRQDTIALSSGQKSHKMWFLTRGHLLSRRTLCPLPYWALHSLFWHLFELFIIIRIRFLQTHVKRSRLNMWTDDLT